MSRPAASLGTMRMIEAVPDRLDGSPRQLRRNVPVATAEISL